MELTNKFLNWLPGTEERVPRHTAPHVNARIERKMYQRLEAICPSPERINRRLENLSKEWDVERALEANAAAAVLAGIGLGIFVNRRFLFLPAAVGVFLMQHAIQGWCPPVPVLRRLGFRTAGEIARERDFLRGKRGDCEADESSAGG